jgi:hypothetical protein
MRGAHAPGGSIDFSSVVSLRLSLLEYAADSADVGGAIAAMEDIDPATASKSHLVMIRSSLRYSDMRRSLALARGLKDAGFDPLAIRDAGRTKAPSLRGLGAFGAALATSHAARVVDARETIISDHEGREITAEDREDIAERLRTELRDGPLLCRFA